MIKKSLLFTLLVLSIARLTAQNNWPPAYEIKADTGTTFKIDDKYWQVLEDSSGKLTFDQVKAEPYVSRFHFNTTRTKGYDYQVTTYWLRYRLKNLLSNPVKIAIPENVAYAWLYTAKAGNQWQVQTNGKLVPWSKRDGLKRITQFMVELQPGQELMFYEKNIFDFNKYKPEFFELTMGFADQVIKASYIDNTAEYTLEESYSFIFGILLLAAFINFLFYRVVKERVYFYFALFVLSDGLYYFCKNTDSIFLREYPQLINKIYVISLISGFYTMMHFIRHFLQTKIHTPRWDKFLILLTAIVAIAWIVVVFGLSSFSFKNYLAARLIAYVFIYSYFPIAVATVIYNMPRNKGADRVGIFAILPGFAWWAIGYTYFFISGVLNLVYKLPFSKFTLWLKDRVNVIELISFLWLTIGFSLILFRRYQLMQKMVVHSSLEKERLAKEREIERSQLIEKQNAELEQKVAHRTAELLKTVESLKQTQSQLIQSEKMASLGELTAGIAHEIQNPLNFVNNFSEVSTELVDEMEEALQKDDKEEALAITGDLKDNLQKITHHGRRADSIVKGMLQHSRVSTGKKEPTDINALADEYLRLSYHGLRAKEKDFNSTIKTNFDESINKMEVVPQDIGRVLLNLYNNAFYAVNMKKGQLNGAFEPTVTVTTKRTADKVEIVVKDNGNGISQKVVDKIFQPFFTTKPTGQGTGLGLSLSYDIIKAHGGEIRVETKEGEGSEFNIQLPISNNINPTNLKIP